MDMRFLRGNPQAPKGHAIFIARSTTDSRTVYCTYCIVPPTPLSLTKYLPSFLAAQLPPEELREAANVNVMPIPPMLEEGSSLEHLEMLAERRDDDLCDIGSINPRDESARMQLVAEGCQEYGQLYLNYTLTFERVASTAQMDQLDEPDAPLDDLDTEELLLQTMTDRERLTELGKLVGVARYALEGHDTNLLQETKQKMQRVAGRLAEKYKSFELTNAAMDSGERGARLAELYLERGFKLLDEEYADIPQIERAIRDLQN
ncbi:MAG TPA: hypothetical protein VKP04_01600 [Ktedonobacteraceae bacterium]|nr:hypothetical protein [Ktedonobacteraceae bacterium]